MVVRLGRGVGRRFAVAVTTAVGDVPDAPTDLTAGAVNFFSLGFSWTAPGDNGSAITDYNIQFRTAAGPGAWTPFDNGTSTSLSVLITGLQPSTFYDVRVAAVSAVGQGPWSTPAALFTAYDHTDVVSEHVRAFYKFPPADRDKDDGPNSNDYDFFTFPDAPVYTAGKTLNGQARVKAVFDPTDGDGSRIDFNYLPLGNIAADAPFMIAFWYTLEEATTSDDKVILEAFGDDASGFDISIIDGTTAPVVQFRLTLDPGGGPVVYTTSGGEPEVGTPTLIIAMYNPDDSEMTLIVDGVVSTVAAIGTPLSNEAIRIGAYVTDTGQYSIQELLFIAGIDVGTDFDVFSQFLWNNGDGVDLEAYLDAP